MDLVLIKKFLMWSTIINSIVMALSFILISCFKDFIYKIHTRWFPMNKDAFHIILYSYLGIYKILIFVFSIVPWIALEVIS